MWRKLLSDLGGSATNDDGAGIVQALGGKLVDGNSEKLGFGGGLLSVNLTQNPSLSFSNSVI
jgi:glycerate kinase